MTTDQKAEEEILAQKLIKGDIEAFDRFVEIYQKKIYALAYNMTHNQMDAQDVTQEVFLTIFRKAHTFQGKSAFSSWVYRVALNAVYMKLRSKKKDQSISVEDAFPSFNGAGYHQEVIRDWSESAESLMFSNETKNVIQNAVDQLPEKEKIAFLLRDVEGLSTEEAAEALDLSISAVKSRLHRARLILRKKLSGYFEEKKIPGVAK
jgi:RNA polymerase sigma-70 factor (ECF subfamily)